MIRAWLVDDEQLALKRLARMLAETGDVEIVGASHDPARAVEELAAQSVDALFLDIEMPGMNGLNCCANWIRRPPWCSPPPTISTP